METDFSGRSQKASAIRIGVPEKKEHGKGKREGERGTAYPGRATRVRRASAPACQGTRPCPAPAKRSPGDIDEGEKPKPADLQTNEIQGAICHERARR
jgi:hypothetical protein